MGLKIDDTDVIKVDKWEKLCTVNLESFKNTGSPIHSQINVYMDGSKTDEHVGSGYVIHHNKVELASKYIRLEEEITVYQAELLAIKHAALRLINIRLKKHNRGTKLVSI